MSAAEHAHADAHGAAGHDDGHHDFDNDPARELPADEPRTPAWIPVLGLVLFFVAAVVWLWSSGNDDAKASADSAQPQRAPAAVQQPAPQPQPQPQPRMDGEPPVPPRPVPPSIGSGAIRQLTPEQARQIQQQIEAMQKQRAAQGQGQPPQ